MLWRSGAWLPAVPIAGADADSPVVWEYPAGSPLVPVSRPWHDDNGAADAFWGPSVHWNSYLERYVMLLNRTRNEHFNNEGIYVSYARVLDDPLAWSVPQKIMDGGAWYPQVAGLEPMVPVAFLELRVVRVYSFRYALYGIFSYMSFVAELGKPQLALPRHRPGAAG